MSSRCFKQVPRECYGVECASDYKEKAEQCATKVSNFNLNGRWSFPDDRFDVVFSSQVIEHLHNTRIFVEETYRVLKPGGPAIVLLKIYVAC